MIMKAAETVEKPVAMMTASRTVYLPARKTRLVMSRPTE